MSEPFASSWGYLDQVGAEMDRHSHPTEEIYIVIKGEGTVVVDSEERKVGIGDVIEIPPNTVHTMICGNNGPFLWAALWWEV